MEQKGVYGLGSVITQTGAINLSGTVLNIVIVETDLPKRVWMEASRRTAFSLVCEMNLTPVELGHYPLHRYGGIMPWYAMSGMEVERRWKTRQEPRERARRGENSIKAQLL